MTRTRSITLLASAAAVFVALSVAACGSSGDSNTSGSSAPPKTASGQPATVGVANENLGRILVNSQGRTLYLFQRDSGTKSTCIGACAIEWPPLRATGKPMVGSGVNASIVATSARSDGKRQVTYNGHPLYLFSGDQQPDDTNGQGVNAFGGLWYALSSSGNQVTTASSGSGVGYRAN
jgi:predicted lipoprotein with Yx(FWY)xxD motif